MNLKIFPPPWVGGPNWLVDLGVVFAVARGSIDRYLSLPPPTENTAIYGGGRFLFGKDVTIIINIVNIYPLCFFDKENQPFLAHPESKRSS